MVSAALYSSLLSLRIRSWAIPTSWRRDTPRDIDAPVQHPTSRGELTDVTDDRFPPHEIHRTGVSTHGPAPEIGQKKPRMARSVLIPNWHSKNLVSWRIHLPSTF